MFSPWSKLASLWFCDKYYSDDWVFRATRARHFRATDSSSSPPAYGAILSSNVPVQPPDVSASEPPTYESIFGEATTRPASQESFNQYQILKAAFGPNCCGIWRTVAFGVLMTINTATIVIGSMYLDQCPLERGIPIWLIVSGIFGFLENCSDFLLSTKHRLDGGHRETPLKIVRWNNFLQPPFLIAIFLAGHILLSRSEDKLSTDINSSNYCEPTCFWFAVWGLYVAYTCGFICVTD